MMFEKLSWIASVCLFLSLFGVQSTQLYAQVGQTSASTATTTNASATTAPTKDPAVEVVAHGNQLQVKVPDQVPLSTVMSSVCQQQKIKCSGTETLASYRGPAMSVEGTLRQVISKLLEGTDVNYELSHNTTGGATAIAFLGHAPHGTAPVPEPAGAQQSERPPLLHSRPYPGPPPSESTPPRSELIPANPSDSGGSPTAVSEGSAQSQEADHSGTILFTGTGNQEPVRYQPFPDSNGHPVPLNNTPVTTQPFPDQFGNPIPVKPSTGGSPFPTKSPDSKANNQGKQ